MKNLVRVLVFIVFAILQSTLLNYVKVGGVKPDILLLAVVFYALSCSSPGFGLKLGILGGLLRDIQSGGVFGLSMLCFALPGMFFGHLGKRVYTESLETVPIQFLIGLSAAIFTFTLYYFLSTIFRSMPPWGESLRLVILPGGMYTALISPVVFWVLRKLSSLRFR